MTAQEYRVVATAIAQMDKHQVNKQLYVRVDAVLAILAAYSPVGCGHRISDNGSTITIYSPATEPR